MQKTSEGPKVVCQGNSKWHWQIWKYCLHKFNYSNGYKDAVNFQKISTDKATNKVAEIKVQIQKIEMP